MNTERAANIVELFGGKTIKEACAEVSLELIKVKLIEHRGNQTAAAKELGINRMTLRTILVKGEGQL